MLVSENSLLSKNSHKSSFNNDNNSVSYPSRTIVHPKLEMTEPGDSDEQEADAAAHDVMSGKVFRKFSGGGAGGGVAVSSQMESQLNQLQGGGQAMPDGLRGMMERGFDRDFSQVRLHTDGEAAGLSSSIHAKAFTHGNDIYFNQGQYAPETSEGQRLVAHELAHVAQGGGKVGRQDEDKHEPENYKPFYGYVVSGYDFSNRFFPRLTDMGAKIEQNAKNLPRTNWGKGDEYHARLDVQSDDTNEKVYKSFSNSNMIVFSGHHFGRYRQSRHFGLFANTTSSKTFSLAFFQKYMESKGKKPLENVEIVISSSCATLCNNKFSNMMLGYQKLFPNAKILGFRQAAPKYPTSDEGYLKQFFDEIEKKGERVNSDYIIALWKEKTVSFNGKRGQPGIWDVYSDTLEYYDYRTKKWIIIKNASKEVKINECAYEQEH